MSEIQPRIPSDDGEPAWEAAYFFPPQGRWSEETFLQFHSNRMAELVDGRLEMLPMPTWLHQLIVEYLFDQIRDHLRDQRLGGKVLMAPLPTKLFPGTVREPDLLYVRQENIPDNIHGYPEKVDLAVEIVSDGDEARNRDYVDKRHDYARAGIPEYWIVDPIDQKVTVLTLHDDHYEEIAQQSGPGGTAKSLLLEGLSIETDEIWSLANSSGSHADDPSPSNDR